MWFHDFDKSRKQLAIHRELFMLKNRDSINNYRNVVARSLINGEKMDLSQIGLLTTDISSL